MVFINKILQQSSKIKTYFNRYKQYIIVSNYTAKKRNVPTSTTCKTSYVKQILY